MPNKNINICLKKNHIRFGLCKNKLSKMNFAFFFKLIYKYNSQHSSCSNSFKISPGRFSNVILL